MKKFTSLFFVLAIALIVAAPAYAQTATRSGKLNIRDAKKKAIVERVDQRISEINANRTTIMLRHLTKIEEILGRIEARTDTVAASGKDVTTVRTAITKARDVIAAAKTAVNAQAAKTYTIEVTTEANLGSAVSAVRTQLAADLRTAHQAVVTARKSIRDVLTALAKIVGEKLTNTEEK